MARKVHIHRHGCYGYLEPSVTGVVGSGWDLRSGDRQVRETLPPCPPREAKRLAKQYIDDHTDEFKEAS
jgi:hypothetical protein